jgi:signal transduction histidine kinase
LEGKGLFEAVRETAVFFEERNQIKVDVRLSGERELPLEIEQTLYRIVQEALSNVARHSQATETAVQLVAKNDMIQLIIEDNGIGFIADEVNQGVGLFSIAERVDGLSGQFDLQSAPNQGTRLHIEIPLKDKA